MPDSIPPTLPSERIPRVKTFPDAAAPAKPAIVPCRLTTPRHSRDRRPLRT